MIAGRDALSRYLKRTAALALLLALTPAAAAAQQGRLATGNWTRGLALVHGSRALGAPRSTSWPS